MSLTRSQLVSLYQALLSAFPRRSDLEQLLRFHLNVRLYEIAGSGSLSDTIFQVIEWAEANGMVEELIAAARAERPARQDLWSQFSQPSTPPTSVTKQQTPVTRQLAPSHPDATTVAKPRETPAVDPPTPRAATNQFNWLHLTDLHWGQEGQGPLWSQVRTAFFEDLERLHARCGPWHAVLFTGDLVYSGKPEQFQDMQRHVLDRLWKKLDELGSGEAVLLAVPGNHDLARPDVKKPSAALRQLLRTERFDEIAEDLYEDPDGEYARIISNSLRAYQDWWRKAPHLPHGISEGLLPGDFAATVEVGKRRIGIAGLNTTFLQLQGGDYKGKLAWDLRQLHHVCGDVDDWVAGHDACLLLTHQGPDWLLPAARDAYPEIYPAPRFAAHLFGHMHEAKLYGYTEGEGDVIRQWQSASLFGLEKFGDPPTIGRRHGYSAGRIEFRPEGPVIRTWPRLATRDGGGWYLVADNRRARLEVDEGTQLRQLPRRANTRAEAVEPEVCHPQEPHRQDHDEQNLVRIYLRAARQVWDIVDLTGLPEDDRHLAMQKFMLRQLYMPLRIQIERDIDETSLPVLEDRRNRLRMIAAGHTAGTESAPQDQAPLSLGEYLQMELPALLAKGRFATDEHSAEAPRLVILGDPGGGKTTLLRWLSTACALRQEGSPDFERLPDSATLPETNWLPILIRCRELDRDRIDKCTLEDCLRQMLTRLALTSQQVDGLAELLHNHLEAGRAALLVDGLDEIADPALRARFCEQLDSLSRRFTHAPMIVTSRIVGYREMRRRVGHGFVHATLADLSSEEKHAFVNRWCEVTVTDPARRATEAKALMAGIHSSDRIERLTSNPMLLTTMALVHRKIGTLLTRRHRLYDEAVALLIHWRTLPDDPPLELDEALPQLQYLAYAMCDRGVQHLRRGEVLELLEDVRRDYPNIRAIHRQVPETFLQQLESRTALLTEVGRTEYHGRSVPTYEFRHLTFQEYLAARALIEGKFPGHKSSVSLADRVRPLAGRLAEVPHSHGINEVVVSESWREALRLCVASCGDDDVDQVLQAVLEPAMPEEARPRAILACLCLADEPNVDEALAERVIRHLTEELRVGDGGGRVNSALDRAAFELDERHWSQLLRRTLVDEFLRRNDETCLQPGGLAAMLHGRDLPPNGPDQEAWSRRQSLLVHSTDPRIAASAALAYVNAIDLGRLVPDPEALSGLLALLNRGGETLFAGLWALHNAAIIRVEGKSRWVPGAEVIESVVNILNDPKALPHCLWVALDLLDAGGSDDARIQWRPLVQHTNPRVRSAARRLHTKFRGNDVDPKLLSRNLDAVFPWIDPLASVSNERVRDACRLLKLPEDEVRLRYEALSREYGIPLEWQSGGAGAQRVTE